MAFDVDQALGNITILGAEHFSELVSDSINIFLLRAFLLRDNAKLGNIRHRVLTNLFLLLFILLILRHVLRINLLRYLLKCLYSMHYMIKPFLRLISLNNLKLLRISLFELLPYLIQPNDI